MVKHDIYRWPDNAHTTRARRGALGNCESVGQLSIETTQSFLYKKYRVVVQQKNHDLPNGKASLSGTVAYYFDDEQEALRRYYELRYAMSILFPAKIL